MRSPLHIPGTPAQAAAHHSPPATRVLVYLNGVYTSDPTISALDRGFVFGDGVYEVWRVVRGALFEADRHRERLEHGLAALRIARPADLAPERLRAIAERLFAENGVVEEGTLYLEITRGAAPRTHYFPPAPTAPTMLVMATPFTPSEVRRRGASVITQPDVRWLRCDLKTIQLLPNVLARQAAQEAGALEAIFVRDGIVTEGTHTSFFAVIDGVLRTHPADALVLPGVTRAVVLELARAEGIAVREEGITTAELAGATEAFLTGTTTDVTPVLRIDGRAVGTGEPGVMARTVLDRLLDRMTGAARRSTARV